MVRIERSAVQIFGERGLSCSRYPPILISCSFAFSHAHFATYSRARIAGTGGAVGITNSKNPARGPRGGHDGGGPRAGCQTGPSSSPGASNRHILTRGFPFPATTDCGVACSTLASTRQPQRELPHLDCGNEAGCRDGGMKPQHARAHPAADVRKFQRPFQPAGARGPVPARHGLRSCQTDEPASASGHANRTSRDHPNAATARVERSAWAATGTMQWPAPPLADDARSTARNVRSGAT